MAAADIAVAAPATFSYSRAQGFRYSYKIKGLGCMKTTSIKLKIPLQDLREFALFSLNTDAAKAWTRGLPVTNTRSVVQQLRHAVSDLNHTRLAPETRYDIMEVLRPNLEVALSNLSRRFLNQPLVMPEEPRQMADLADSLLSLVSTAYTVVAIESIQQPELIRRTNPARLACESIQRALVFSGRKILQTFQLYHPIELNGWLALHQLYALADSQQLANLPVTDALSGGATVTATYLQALLLGCSKPNQLSQADMAGVYRGLQQWTELLQLQGPETGEGLFLVDLDNDQPPLYSSLYSGSPGQQFRYIDTSPLIDHVEQLKLGEGVQGISLDKDSRLASSTLDHLVNALGSVSLRNFNRSESSSPLWVSIGLSSTHYHVAGECLFEELLNGSGYVRPAADKVATNPFLLPQKKGDLWQQANPEEDYAAKNDLPEPETEAAIEHQVELDEDTRAELEGENDAQISPEERYPIYKVKMANASPGGYCLEWTAELPGDIRAGDIVGIKEEHNRDWVIAVIRWVSHLEHARTLIGLELLSPRAMPYGAVIRQKTGEESAPMRVLLLPEIKLVGQPHTLITPRAGFKERQKIALLGKGEDYSIQLSRQVAATGSFAQFDFRYIRQLGDLLSEARDGHLGSSYDSIWSKI
jgi:hypothetical protein